MTNGGFRPFRVGEVRRGQALHTYGVGSVIDLPLLSVMPLGLQAWRADVLPLHEVIEERLLDVVRGQLGAQVDKLYMPPVPRDSSGMRRDPFGDEATIGLPVVPFPKWARCPQCQLLAPLDYGVFRLESQPYKPDKTRFVHQNCAKSARPPAVVPARFVAACEHGHLDDFPWLDFVHGGANGCTGPLSFTEGGLSSEVAELYVNCNGCGTSKPMLGAVGEDGQEFFEKQGCTGRHWHLGSDFQEACEKTPRAILVGATNLWFAVQVPSLTIPTALGRLGNLVEQYWKDLGKAKTEAHVAAMRQMGMLDAFDGWTDEQLWAAIGAKKSGSGSVTGRRRVADLKAEEWDSFAAPESVPDHKDFCVRRTAVPDGFSEFLADVVLVDRLRVVKALVGFTRVGSPGNYGDVGDLPDVIRAPLTRVAPTWVPASEVRGEGVFLRLREDALERWLARDDVSALAQRFRDAHAEFRTSRRIPNPSDGFDGMRYVLLHTLSHSLIRQFSIECGYSAASVEERIYSVNPSAERTGMAGILLYTAAPDSEGTLGGLVALGEPDQLGRHLRTALGRLRLCPSDPLCAESGPDPDRGVLHGASCHACTFVSETSCEAGNKYLDRSVLVRTVAATVEPFFVEELARALV